MKTLPKYFIVLRDATNPLWDKYIQWLRTTYKSPWSGSSDMHYYGYDGNTIEGQYGVNCFRSKNRFQNNPTIITLEYWNECVNGFQLPEKWCIRITKDNRDVVKKWFLENYKSYQVFSVDAFYGNEAMDSTTIRMRYEESPTGFTEITFEQFKKYVLKEEDMKEYKFTPEYCKTHKVAIYVDTPEEVKLCDELLNNNLGHYYLYNHLSYREGDQAIDCQDSTHCSVEYFNKNSYEVIKAKDFIKFNTKNMKKKIIGYKLIKPEFRKASEKIMGYPYGSDGITVTSPTCIKNLKETAVLDEWFEPVYEEVKFKVDDFVTVTKSTGEGTRGWWNIGDVYILTDIDDYHFSVKSFYNGTNGYSFEHVSLRLSTPEEILNFKVKEFTYKTDIKVGDTILSPGKIKDSIVWEDEKWRDSIATGNRVVERFKLHPDGKTLLMQVTGTAHTVWHDAYKMKKANATPDITIRGYKATFTKNSVTFGCQTYSKEFVVTLAKCLTDNGFDMDIKSEIVEIAEYFKS